MNNSFVKTWVYRDTIPSTNDLAKAILLDRNETLPMVVWTRCQTQGRGRGTHVWWSDGGSLTFTMALDPAAHGLEVRHEPRVALATAVAIVDALMPWRPHPPLGIRWPNDIEAGGRKVGGLLPERVETPAGPRLIVGVGLNVLSRLDKSPQDVRRMAVSLAELSGVSSLPTRPEEMLEPLLSHLNAALDRLSRDDPSLAQRWKELDTLKGQPIRIAFGARIVEGVARGIDDKGALQVDSAGERFPLFGGQVLREDA